MNLIFHRPNRNARRSERGIALVITLLMLSVITFLAVAFLAMTRRDRAAVAASEDVDGARNMSDAALNRAQSEIIAQMLARGDALSYDYMVSRNYISQGGFQLKSTSLNNVNYDYLSNSPGSPLGVNSSLGAANWADNIGNLFYDPRAPVFVLTNSPSSGFPASNDFRFWVDINRNGRFETNGYLPYIAENGANTGVMNYFNGEPEWIGVLRDPLNRHSPTNRFIGRYAYMVLPIGKTLDLNYIHNWLKGIYSDEVGTLTNNFFVHTTENPQDGFARDEGIGSWELNLAGMLDILSTNAYQNGFPGVSPGFYSPTLYQYYPPTTTNASVIDTPANTGSAFADAESILHYRYYYTSQPKSWVPNPASSYYIMGDLAEFGITDTNYTYNNDLFCMFGPFTNDYHSPQYLAQPLNEPWPGSYNTNMFYDPQDLFDTNKTSAAFTNRLMLAGERTNSEDRYTFERLLANIGTGSQPEYGVWVYGDAGQPVLRTKVNLNYDNTVQLTNGPYTPMPTNLVGWTPLRFFTNAAELLLRSQTYNYAWTNFANVGGVMVPSNILTTNLYFGVTNIPIFRVDYPEVQYTEAVHRMLQLAANIYSATTSTNSFTSLNSQSSPPPVRHPVVFQPVFQVVGAGTSNWGVNIIGFSNVVDSAQGFSQMRKPFIDLNSNNFVQNIGTLQVGINNGSYNISGIPWVVSAEKNLPQFNQYSYENRVTFTRKLLFVRNSVGGKPDTNSPPEYTNQFYIMCVSNNFGLDAWNPYLNKFYGSQTPGDTMYISNYVTVQITNEYGAGFTSSFTNFYQSDITKDLQWSAMQSQGLGRNGIYTPFETNIGTVPPCYFSESTHQFMFFTNGLYSSNQFLASDLLQKSWPVHNWTVNITNHLVYALFDGVPNGTGNSALLDFVNLGPFGSSLSVTQAIMNVNDPANGTSPNYVDWLGGSDLGTSIPTGVYNQISEAEAADPVLQNELIGKDGSSASFVFGPDTSPSNIVLQTLTWVANDPLVHYTLGDLTWPVQGNLTNANVPLVNLMIPLTNSVGMVSARYQPWGRTPQLNNMLYEDPGVTSPSVWQFPTNKFPSIGWLGRVHRGTPWQTVYFKADNPSDMNTNDLASDWLGWVNNLDTYPTHDWALPDLFTTAPNDNAARGLLSVNQTNDAAWAAVLSGVMMPTNSNGSLIGVPIGPNNVYSFVDSPGGLNATRAGETNGLFHRLGDILATPALTTSNMFLANVPQTGFPYSDEVEERIPQQILGLLKVGEPQFVIYSWGESLRPKNIYLTSPHIGLCTNYEITGEFLSRTVCHVVHTNGTPKMVIDSYNIEPTD